ncbi:hypothetical protein [Nonomuraea sp. NPDC049158]|uniref:hypothetical protein n=1 Tax=Nonomuraea sp. NPDC049158 TaxID=3155649 RepID=UPI0033D5E086
MVLGHDDDLAADATRTSNRLHGLLTSIHPALERVHRAAYAGYREAMREYVDVNVTLGASNAAQMVAGSPMQIRMQTTMMRLVNRLPWKDLAMRPIMKPLNEAANALTLAAY